MCIQDNRATICIPEQGFLLTPSEFYWAAIPRIYMNVSGIHPWGAPSPRPESISIHAAWADAIGPYEGGTSQFCGEWSSGHLTTLLHLSTLDCVESGVNIMTDGVEVSIFAAVAYTNLIPTFTWRGLAKLEGPGVWAFQRRRQNLPQNITEH
jgi:hypothetical protein